MPLSFSEAKTKIQQILDHAISVRDVQPLEAQRKVWREKVDVLNNVMRILNEVEIKAPPSSEKPEIPKTF